MDSRTSSELVFDQGIGDIFSLRVAGNVLTDEMIGSMEYACKYVGTKLILVLGHSKCGAATGACKGGAPGKLGDVLHKFDASINEVREEMPNVDQTSTEFIEAVANHNVIHTMDAILEQSSVLKELFNAGEIGVAGAYYNVETGNVEFLKENLHE